ncbi:MAG: VWA domain-containing protein [Haloglomus sp.]
MPRDKKTSTDEDQSIPFTGIIGQEELKNALLAIGTNDELNGLLIRGEKGTAKSTAVRAMSDLLPEQRVIANCPYSCPPDDPAAQCSECRERTDPATETRAVPLVTLPLGATRERIVGSLSVEKALDGNPEFEPGLLARANRGILYVDEVNLLDDHLVDVILDAAASGVNRVERDGVSVSHPAQFTLVGTMNPEEGDLRPQLKDRFALQATVEGRGDIDERVQIVDRVLAQDRGTGETMAEERRAADALRDDLRRARELLPAVELPTDFTEEIAELCRDAGVDGHRADIATARTALAFAALDERTTVIEGDVRRAAELALPHRLQSKPFEDAPEPDDVIDDHFEDGDDEGEAGDEDRSPRGDGDGGDEGDAGDEGEADGEGGDDTDRERGPDPERESTDDGSGKESDGSDSADGSDSPDGSEEPDGRGDGSPRPAEADPGDSLEDESEQEGESDGDGANDDDESEDDAERGTPRLPGQSTPEPAAAQAPEIDMPATNGESTADGSRSGAKPSPSNRGARVRTEPVTNGEQVDAAASVRAAVSRGSTDVESRDLRRSVRAGETSALVVFAVDTSASMRGPMRMAKGVALELLKDAYQQRDEVALVAFAGDGADVILPPTDNVGLAARHLKELPTGDRTPLPSGLRTAGDVIRRADPEVSIVFLVTDGRVNTVDDDPIAATQAAAAELPDQTHVVVVDAESQSRVTLTGEIIEATDGERIPLQSLSAERVEHEVARARDQ